MAFQERWIEARHAKNKRAIAAAHNVGPAFVAFQSSLPKLHSILASGSLGELAALCARVPTFMKMVHEMGFDHHPEVQRVRQKYSVIDGQDIRNSNRGGGKELKKILFHCDRQTMHTAIEDLDVPDVHYPPRPPYQPDARDDAHDEDNANDGGGDTPSSPPPPPPPPWDDGAKPDDDHASGGDDDLGDDRKMDHGNDDDPHDDGSGDGGEQPPTNCLDGQWAKSCIACNSSRHQFSLRCARYS